MRTSRIAKSDISFLVRSHAGTGCERSFRGPVGSEEGAQALKRGGEKSIIGVKLLWSKQGMERICSHQ